MTNKLTTFKDKHGLIKYSLSCTIPNCSNTKEFSCNPRPEWYDTVKCFECNKKYRKEATRIAYYSKDHNKKAKTSYNKNLSTDGNFKEKYKQIIINTL